MSTPSAHAAICRWANIVEGKTTDPALTSSNVFVRGDRVYSYGSHFELARPLRDKRKRIRGYLFNGDTAASVGGWRRSQTGAHQFMVRNALAESKVPKVILPHSALEAAGVDLNSVHLVHVKEDRWETIEHRTTTMPEGAVWRTEQAFEYQELTPEEIAERTARWGREPQGFYERRKYVPLGVQPVLHLSWRKYSEVIKVTRQEDGTRVYEWTTQRHWMGESLIRARVNWLERGTCPDCGGFGTYPYVGLRFAGDCPACNGSGTRPRDHHRWTLFLSGFDHQEPAPLYFLCELPYHCQATTVEEAYEALKPAPVKLAEQMGRSYTRQGDIFAIPAPSMTDRQLRAMGARIEMRSTRNSPRPTHFPYILGTNHTASQVAYLPGVTLAKGLLYHDPFMREPDHIRRKMGDGKAWHVVVKNTVPTSTRR